ncbi:unnamed protein product [Paramecium pentaurelia]|uniref:Uncharacterized protein n=1 Tax=Paramecium pentaurelia TaxID=43138 RepID=A0A8S1UYE9_9CILI|nr:unnamed protein product [Paramecium pentaurelia]
MTFFILLMFQYLSSLEIKEMESIYQYSQKSITVSGVRVTPTFSTAFRYGLWSKYNPLTSILQVGSVGLFDSDCFHLHSAVEESSLTLNLIYYDCIDISLKKITKTIAFIDNDSMQHSYTIDIDPFEYENVWYYIQILQWPLQERFELIFIYKEKIIRENLKIKQPFKDQSLKLIFGGGMIVQQSMIETIVSGTKFAYFPGKMIKVEYEFGEISVDEDQEQLARMAFEPYSLCICNMTSELRLEDNSMKYLDNLVYISENINCNSFELSGWLKIADIIQSSDEFIYPFLILSSNFQNSLSKITLSPFTLSYKISPIRNQIIVTTYSYTFPSVISDDQQLIQKEFDILNSITLWQKVKITLIADQLIINIKFYENYDYYEYSTNEQVNQFKCTQFKLLYGNINQSRTNYLNILFRNILFNNCETDNTIQSCHHSCQECDGPSQNNCLSCRGLRIYLPEFKACVCPFNTIDQENCVSYIDSELELSSLKKKMPKCKYGYFEYENDCIRCPSIINDQVATCQECLQNPQGWSKEPYCENDLFLNQNGDVKTNFWLGYQVYYLFDGIDLMYCKNCNSSYSFIVDDYNVKSEITLKQQIFLFLDEYPYCDKAIKNIQGHYCILCDKSSYPMNDGNCTLINEDFNQLDCLAPYYINSLRRCKLCPILNCKYCFEYQSNDLTKCTLYNNFDDFNSDQEIKIGCALCEDNFIFDFDAGICLFNIPKIQYCLRSYIYDGQEVCTLSQIQDFSLAPEIINCQNLQPHCLQCIQSPEFTIKCIICQIGYVTSVTTGGCYQAQQYKLQGSKIIIEGVYSKMDGWVQRIQSFMMQFLPNKYFYFQSKFDQMLSQIAVECKEGYQLSSSAECSKYCDPSCLNCKLHAIQGYYCNTCPLNYYYQPIRDQRNGKCFECTQLCQACQVRTDDEINRQQPKFIIDNNNLIYTTKCLKPVQHPQIYLDPYDQIAKYCFDENCSQIFLYQKTINYCYWFDIMWQTQLNIEYFNKLSLDSLIVRFTFTSPVDICTLANFYVDSQIKTKVFSLKYIHFILNSRKDLILLIPSLIYINNIDKLEINQIIFLNLNSPMFVIQNNNEKTELSLQNVIFLETEIQNIQSIFSSKRFGDIQIRDVQLLNINFVNSSILNVKDCLISGVIIIENFVIRNCTFLNSNFFQFMDNKVILSVKHLLIEDSVFTNSHLYYFDSNIQQLSKLEFYNVKVQQSKFLNSSLINCYDYVSLSMINLQFNQNILFQSNIFASNYNLSLQYVQVMQNQFVESQFISLIEENYNLPTFVLIDQIDVQNNQFQNSKFLRILTNQESSQVDLEIRNLIFDQIVGANNSDNNQYLFKIRCFKLKIQDLIFRNLKNLLIFYIFEGKDIMISNVLYENSVQIYQLPFSQYCQVKINEKNQLLKIENFYTLIITSVQIINQFTIDESFVDLLQAKDFSSSSKLEITELKFIGNLQLFKQSQKSFSLLTINSEQSIIVLVNRITFLENCFHSQADSFLQSYSSLLFFNIKSSKVQIINLLSERNAFTNSSNSFVYINSKTLFMQNLQISNHNVLTYKLWEKFYGVKLDQFFNQQQINLFAFQTFNITNIGGVGQITASMFTCLNCQFYNIFASKSSIFEIKTEDFGIIKLTQIKANYIISDLKQVSNSSGCISIYSFNSLLDITIQQSEFQNVFNRMSSSILSIQPSKIKNRISLIDIQIYDCLSLMNQILFVEFSNKIIDQNNLDIRNIIITQNIDSWILLFTQMGNISFTELLDISSSQNSLFYIESGSISMINISFAGLYLSPILSIVNAPILKLQNLQIEQLQRFYSFNLIIINQMIDIQSKVLMHQVSIVKSLNYQAGLQKIFLQNFNFILDGCIVVTNQSTETSGNQHFYFLNEILNTMEKHTQTTLSLIYIQSLSKKNSFYFNQLKILENNCINCINGLIYFELLNFQNITIQELNCNYNVMTQYGCLKIVDENQESLPIRLINSNFIQNNGSQGIAISSNSPISIKNCKIISNIASFRGGGIYLKLNSYQFIIKNSIIVGNKAKEGGGIFFSGDSNLNQNNFIQTYLLFNYAYDYANNVVESPTHLALFVNSQEMQGDKLKLQKILTNILRIFPYMTIEQEIKIKTAYLMIPSGQAIQGYSLFIPKKSQSVKQIKQIELIYKNNLNELQKNLVNSSCVITENIVKMNEQIVENQQHAQLLFNTEKNHFDLSSISFTLDPYIQENKYLEIGIICSTQEYKNSLKYIIQAKSYKCQLGEFYVDNGCQICESNQGFYSVTYDSIKCSIFDKEKFQEIASNQIKLLEGYWRPNYQSDQSTLCFKITSFCLGGWGVGDALCSKGHVGALCEECDIYNVQGNGKFIKNQQNSECFLCFSAQDSILPFILNTLWAILSIILTLKSIGKSNDLFLLYKIQGSFNQILFKLNQDLEGILIKMLLNYLWIFSVIFSLNISFSFQFNFVDQASNQSYSMANNLDCYLSEIASVEIIYSKIILIWILILLQFIVIIFGLIIFSIIINQKFKLDNISNTLLCLYIFNYAGFIKMLCSVVSYREISNIQYISGDLTLEFNTETHHQWIMYLILPGLIIFGCLIPLSLFLLMYFKRNDLDNHIFRPHICYLYNEYEKESYYWEQIKLSKRAIMILILTYFETNIHLKASLIGLSLIIYQLLAINKKPYIMTKFNKFDLSTGQMCSISIFLSTIKYESEKLNNQMISLALQVCLMILFVLITFPFIHSIIQIYYKKYKLILLKYLFLIFKYFRLKQASKKFELILNEKYQKEQRIKDNYLKLRQFLLIISKAQLKYRPALESTFNSRKNYQQKLISSAMQGQSILLTGQRLQ